MQHSPMTVVVRCSIATIFHTDCHASKRSLSAITSSMARAIGSLLLPSSQCAWIMFCSCLFYLYSTIMEKAYTNVIRPTTTNVKPSAWTRTGSFYTVYTVSKRPYTIVTTEKSALIIDRLDGVPSNGAVLQSQRGPCALSPGTWCLRNCVYKHEPSKPPSMSESVFVQFERFCKRNLHKN